MGLKEYLEELKIINPQEYEVNGFYNFHKKQNKFTGLFEIDDNKKILGKIEDL